jgi:hypothetical protein
MQRLRLRSTKTSSSCLEVRLRDIMDALDLTAEQQPQLDVLHRDIQALKRL